MGRFKCYMRSLHGGVHVLEIEAEDIYAAGKQARNLCPEDLVLRVERDQPDRAADRYGAAPSRYAHRYDR